MKKTKVKLLMVILLALTSQAWGQAASSVERDVDWQLSLIGGVLTGGTYSSRTENSLGERVHLKTDEGFMTGLRLSAEQEYLGLELSAAGVFHDMNLEAGEWEIEPEGSNATLILTDLNVLMFPTGNDLADGRVRPFVTVGPGLAFFMSDYDQIDSELMFAANVGAGIKFLLGDEGSPVLRFDWRWHQIIGSTTETMENSIYRQEFSVGIGLRF